MDSRADPVHPLSPKRAFGVGFITTQIPRYAENFRVCLEERVPIFAFSFGDPTSYVAQARSAGAKVLCQVQTLEAARLALAAGTDVLVAQGNEAGGHTGRLGTLLFLAQVLDTTGSTPVIASGESPAAEPWPRCLPPAAKGRGSARPFWQRAMRFPLRDPDLHPRLYP